jgi:hypothetical protein
MTSEVKILYADTNAFLQVRDLKDIPWGGLFAGVRAVDVMVAPRIIEELDKHKSGTNQRRRDRARAALQLIDMASREKDRAIVVRENPIRVRIVISAAPKFNWDTHPTLDPAKPDDQLVAEALSFGNGAVIFSHDSGPRIRARIAGLQAFEPEPEWLLPAEQTDDQRKITTLERDLKRALSTSPTIVAGFDNYDESTSEVRAIIPVLHPLEPEQIERLSNAYLAKHPRARLGAAIPSIYAHQRGGLSEAQIQRYHEKYSSFEADVRAFYADLHERVRNVGSIAVGYFVENDSGVSARGLRIEFYLEGDGSLLADRTAGFLSRKKGLEMPEPPQKPRSMPDFANIALPHIQKPRDPVRFYWFERPEIGSKHSALQCQDFRATRKYYDTMFVMPFDKLPATMTLRLHVSAENLSAPINVSATLNIVEQAVDWSDEVVRKILLGVEED